jgi:hypothetical protein
MRKSGNEGIGLSAFVERNLFAILIGMAWIFSGWNSADAVTVEQVKAIKERLDRQEAKIDRLLEGQAK